MRKKRQTALVHHMHVFINAKALFTQHLSAHVLDESQSANVMSCLK